MEYNVTDDGPRVTTISPTPVWSSANKSDENLVEVTSSKCFYQKSSAIRRLKLVILLAALLLLILSIVLIIISVGYFNVSQQLKENYKVCRTPECLRTATSLLLSIDKSVNPCDDFYSYVCGKWADEHPIPDTSLSSDWFTERTAVGLAKIKEYLQQKSVDDEPFPTVQARLMFEACIDHEKLQELGVEPLKEVLSEMNLPLIPPMDEDSYSSDIKISELFAMVKTTIGRDFILYSNVFPDVTNRSRNLISITEPEKRSILPGNAAIYKRKIVPYEYYLKKALVSEKPRAVKQWKDYYLRVIKYFLKVENETGIGNVDILNTLDKLLSIHIEIQKVMTNENITIPNDTHPTVMDITQLQALTDEAAKSVDLTPAIKWDEYFNTMFQDSNVTLNIEEEELAVYTKEYYKAISKVLSSHSEYEIVLYIWAEVVNSLIPFTNDELNSYRDSFYAAFGGPPGTPREAQCIQSVWQVMDKAIAYGFIKDVDIKSIRDDVNKMIDNIEFSLTNSIATSDWIDVVTRIAIIDKAKNIKRDIGFADWLLDPEEVNGYYSGLNITNDTHMWNFVNAAQLIIHSSLDQLRTVTDFSFSDYDPVEVNAQYVPQSNSIMIPLGILQFPFYRLGIDALNYGSVGVIIGHELTHAFDTTGREYDKFGNVQEWWTNKTTENYLDRTQCFIDQYNSYYLQDIEETVDGNLTLAENIADNGGLKDAFYGYKRLKEEKGYRELKLPGLEDFSSEKLFYLGFAHEWCENWTPNSMKLGLDDEHSPNFIRVIGSVSNSKEFAETWNCPVDADMNHHKKCQLW